MSDLPNLPVVVYLNGSDIHRAYNPHAAECWMNDNFWPLDVELDISGRFDPVGVGDRTMYYNITTEPLKPKAMSDMRAIAKVVEGGYGWIYYDEETRQHWTNLTEGGRPENGDVGPWRHATREEVAEHEQFQKEEAEYRARQAAAKL